MVTRVISLCRADFRRGRIDTMQQYFEQAIALNPKDAATLNAYGYSLAEYKIKLNKARSMIERAIAIEPANLSYMDSFAWVMYRQGEPKRAESLLTWLFFKDQQHNPELAAHLGELLWQRGDRINARWIWRSALQEHPDNRYLHFTLRKLNVDHNRL